MNRRHIPTPYAPPPTKGISWGEYEKIFRALSQAQASGFGMALRGEPTAKDIDRESAIRAYQRAQDARVARMGPDERRAEDEAWRERLRNLSGGRNSRGSL